MSVDKFSQKQLDLLHMYAVMAKSGYDTADGSHVSEAFNDFELRKVRSSLKPILRASKSILDYGSGGADWERLGFDIDSGKSAKDFFNIEYVFRYEPARGIDQRTRVDTVICFDVLEHLFIHDVTLVIRDILSLASQSVIVNVACYPARALLPNGENAHTTVRHPYWWKGIFDALAPEYPEITIHLLCSTSHGKIDGFKPYSALMWQQDSKFVVDY